jgi:hypothetical protein
MRRTILTAVVAATVTMSVAGAARATDVGYSRKFGMGVELGDPTGIVGKLWIAPTNALDFGVGFWGGGLGGNCWHDANGNLHCDGFSSGTLNIDYLWQSNIVRGTAQLDWHIGAGGRFIWFGGPCDTGCSQIGARAPIGLDLMFSNPSFLEIFFELAPALYVVPGVFLSLEGGLGVRGYF